MKRSLISESNGKVDKKVLLQGWIDSIRDHGKLTFFDLRDRTGIVQCVVLSDKRKGFTEIGKMSSESVVEIEGVVNRRPEKLVNENLETGAIEIVVEKGKILSRSLEIPLPIDTDGYEIDEKVRMKYRYLDLRRNRMAKNMRRRAEVVQFIRNRLFDENFVEIETPILTKTTPEGARDFIVPSRLQQGKFYALPQSPQQYKQLLMVAGMERYFQIARCFRDEDPRADRAYGEFTQLDMEMSFVTQEDILALIEKLFTQLVKEIFPHKKITQSPWPRLSHKKAMEKYGSDKPDLRKNKDDENELAFSWIIDFPLFVEQSDDDYFHGSGKAKWAPSHHMFTSPNKDDLKYLDKDPGCVRGLQHDLALNGFEVGGGSIRIHEPHVQQKVFDLIGFNNQQKDQFEHLLSAFKYGVPPHGGIAFGLDRLLMAIMGEQSLREVIAFPATAGGQTAVMDAPSEPAKEQLKELGIRVNNKK